jgi:hypothetical protein
MGTDELLAEWEEFVAYCEQREQQLKAARIR